MAHGLALVGLPELELHGMSEAVRDETEIPRAVARLLERLNGQGAIESREVHLCYDGTSDRTLIRVTVAVGEPMMGTRPVTLPGAGTAAVIRFGERPVNTGDAWLMLDTALRGRGLTAVGPYRQTIHGDGSVTLAVPVSSGTPRTEAEASA